LKKDGKYRIIREENNGIFLSGRKKGRGKVREIKGKFCYPLKNHRFLNSFL
jgi:hypothetical protein